MAPEVSGRVTALLERRPIRIAVVTALVATHVVICVVSVRHKSITTDEPSHFRYGASVLAGDSTRFDDSKMPVTALNAAFARLAPSGLPTPRERRQADIHTGRHATMLFSALVALLVFHWSSSLYGPRAGCLSLFLYAFSPTVLAHARFVTTDVYAAGMVLLSCYAFWAFCNRGGFARAAGSALALGASQLVKFTCAYLVPVFVAIAAVRSGPALLRSARAGAWGAVARALGRFGAWTALFAALGALAIDAGYLGNGFWTPLRDYRFGSELFQDAQQRLAFAGDVPVPLPVPYLTGLDWVKFNEQSGAGRGYNYLFGEATKRALPGYYLIAGVYKLPLAAQALFLLALFSWARRFERSRFLRDEIFLWAPVLFFGVYFNFFYKAQIGIRHLLVVFPLIHVFCGTLVRGTARLGPWTAGAVPVLLVYLAVSTLSYHPHYLSYFNELMWDRKRSFEVLADSNLDWGQNEWYYQLYKEAHPGIVRNPREPVAGRIVLSVNALTGVTRQRPMPLWYVTLRERFRPVDHIAYSFLVYDLSEQDAALLRSGP